MSTLNQNVIAHRLGSLAQDAGRGLPGFASDGSPFDPASIGRDAPVSGDIPPTDDPANAERRDRISLRKKAQWIHEQFTKGLDARRKAAFDWMRVGTIMEGVHYFTTKGGYVQPLARKEGQIRAVVPVMKPKYRRELGRLNANQIGVTVTAKTAKGRNAFYQAMRGQAIMEDWAESVDIQEIHDSMNQILLFFGFGVYYRFKDRFRRTVDVDPIPGPRIFPIPYDAESWKKSDGVMHAKIVSRQWLEQQDESFTRRHGKAPTRKMARSASSYTARPHGSYLGFGTNIQWGGAIEGATAIWFWMKPSETMPAGEMGLMIEDEIVRYSPRLEDGDIPMEPVYYTDKPSSWWGDAFLVDQIAPQLEANRQLTQIILSARHNRGFLAYDTGSVDQAAIQDNESGLIPIRNFDLNVKQKPIIAIPPQNVGREVGSVLGLVEQFSDVAAGHESDIIFGRQEGRTEGGPATQLLNENAQAPLVPVINGQFRALKHTYPRVLDMLRDVWPDQKVVSVTGEHDIAAEMIVRRDDMPWSRQVRLKPTPMLVNGRNAMVNFLLRLRTLPGDDGKPAMIKEREFRRSIRMLDVSPPGLDLVDKTEQRIMYRVAVMIGDGQRPGMTPDQVTDNRLRFEHHRMAVEILRDKILEEGYTLYSPDVQELLRIAFEFHQSMLETGTGPERFDDDLAELDARQQDNQLEAFENDPETIEGLLSQDGMLLGVA